MRQTVCGQIARFCRTPSAASSGLTRGHPSSEPTKKRRRRRDWGAREKRPTPVSADVFGLDAGVDWWSRDLEVLRARRRSGNEPEVSK